MKTVKIVTFSVFFFSVLLHSQNKLSLNIVPGIYLSNSENSLPIVGEERYRWYLNFGLSYERDNVLGINLKFDYTFNQTTLNDALTFVITGSESPDPLGTFGADVSLTNHIFDFSYLGSLGNYLIYGFGPSFIITNRTINIEHPFNYKVSLYDKLASSGIGLNGFLEFSIPLDENQEYFFLTSKLKFRYTYSIWFDEGLRKLDNYHQEFITCELNVGIGYSF